MSSVGVQMTGTCFPKLRNQRSIGRRMSSFARCVQFQVNKKSIRYTDAYATWNASSVVARGIHPFRTNSFPMNSTSSVGPRTRTRLRLRSLNVLWDSSPRAASSNTISDVTSSYRCRWSSHHVRVIACFSASPSSSKTLARKPAWLHAGPRAALRVAAAAARASRGLGDSGLSRSRRPRHRDRLGRKRGTGAIFGKNRSRPSFSNHLGHWLLFPHAHDHRGGPVALRPPHGARHHPQRRGGREPRGHERCGGADHRRSPRAAAEGDRVCDGRARGRQNARGPERGHTSR